MCKFDFFYIYFALLVTSNSSSNTTPINYSDESNTVSMIGDTNVQQTINQHDLTQTTSDPVSDSSSQRGLTIGISNFNSQSTPSTTTA